VGERQSRRDSHTQAGISLTRWARHSRQAVTHRGGGVRASRPRHVVRFAPWSEAETACAGRRLVVRGGDLSCEAETRRARRKLVV
jgi:hypothetical protein